MDFLNDPKIYKGHFFAFEVLDGLDNGQPLPEKSKKPKKSKKTQKSKKLKKSKKSKKSKKKSLKWSKSQDVTVLHFSGA